MLSEKEYDEIYQKGYEDGKNENKLVVEYAIKPSFTTRKLKEQQKEIERLNNIINEVANDILKELNENKHLSYGVALSIRQKLLNYQELKEGKIDVKK